MAVLRDQETSPQQFRQAAQVMSSILAIESTSRLRLRPATVRTPLEEAQVGYLASGIAVVPVLRAGLSMLDTYLSMFPDVAVGYIGIQRDEEHVPKEYYVKLPELSGRDAFCVDPMLASGGTACHAVSMLKDAGANSVAFVSVIASPEGVDRMKREHPDVEVYAAALDRELNADKYILPGLGDYGDRLYGTDEL